MTRHMYVLRRSMPVVMGWHEVANAAPGNIFTGCQFFATPGNIFAIFYCFFIFLAKERSPEILVQLNLGLCDILEFSIFSCTNIVHLIVTTGSMQLALRFCTMQFSRASCHPYSTSLAKGLRGKYVIHTQ